MPTNPELPVYFNYQHPLVRDLCWTLSPEFDVLAALPPYRRFVPSQPSAQLHLWLNQLDREPQTLERFMALDTRTRLGHHFERLVLFYLSQGPGSVWQLLHHNLAIYGTNPAGHRITVGELDFLIADHSTAKTLHLETAVKFFLGVEHEGKTFWLGPGLHDRLDRKIHHLQTHQLPLSQRIEKQNETPIERYFWLKGILFQPWQQNLSLNPDLLAQPIDNRWLTCAEALSLGDEADWVCLPKSRWLGCAWQDLTQDRLTATQILEHFKNGNRVLMLTHRLSPARRLLVADDWDQAARAALKAQAC